MPYNPADALDRYILAEALLVNLRDAGFIEDWHGDEQGRDREPGDFTKERTFYRPVEDTRVRIRIFTTIEGDRVRASGTDAIRVLTVYKTVSGKDKVLSSETRIHRVGEIKAIVDRMMNRARDLWRASRAAPRCSRCGAPTFVSKKGHPVCADVCWTSSNRPRPT